MHSLDHLREEPESEDPVEQAQAEDPANPELIKASPGASH
jgi:hypothetical protein